MSSRCRTSGNIPGLPPGILRSTRSRCRPSTSISPSSSSICCLQELYLHPTGQIPAYEWNFSDVNPPVQAWAAIFLYRMEQALRGEGRSRFSEARLRAPRGEFRLVGQSQGPLRQKSVRGRVSRTGQYRRIRPQRAVADRRPSGAGGRHGLGGAVLPEHARDRRRTGGARPDLRGIGSQLTPWNSC